MAEQWAQAYVTSSIYPSKPTRIGSGIDPIFSVSAHAALYVAPCTDFFLVPSTLLGFADVDAPVHGLNQEVRTAAVDGAHNTLVDLDLRPTTIGFLTNGRRSIL